MLKKFLVTTIAIFSSFAFGATTNPVQLLNPTGSTAGQAVISTGATTAPSWGIPSPDPKVINVISSPYNAKGDSNGTHGNGTDNTAAFQAAFNAANSSGASIFIPCGTYRITAPITVTDSNARWIYGSGACSKIYSDQNTANTTFSFSPSVGTCGAQNNQPCAVIKDMTFIAPNTVGSGQTALYFNNYNSPYVDNVQFIGQQVSAGFVNSFAPRFHNNRVYGGVAAVYSTDLSFNSGEIWSNSFYNITGNAVQIEPVSNCVANVSIKNNDFEQAAVALKAGGLCGATFADNYIENTHTQTPFNFTGSNFSMLFRGNLINGATDSGTGAMSIANLNNAQWVNNNFININVSYGSGASGVRLRAAENTLFNSTLPVPSAVCTGNGTGGTCTISGDDQFGYVNMNTGSSPANGGTVTLTFTNALGANHASCSWTPIHNTGTWTAPATVIGGSAATTSTIGNWANGATLTASKSYLLGYQCQGW